MTRTPPAKVPTTDKVVEDDADDDPLPEVPTGRGGDLSSSTKDGREEDVSQNTPRVFPGQEVLDDHAARAYEPEPVEPAVQSARC